MARVEQRAISVDEAKSRSVEVFLIGGSLPVMPVVQVGGKLGGKAAGCERWWGVEAQAWEGWRGAGARTEVWGVLAEG